MTSSDRGLDGSGITARHLTGIGPVEWSKALECIEGWSALWQAADGLRCGRVPAAQPWATHMWAWSGDVAARVRIDRTVHLAFLGSDPDLIQQLSPGQPVERVNVLSRQEAPGSDPLVIWQPTDRRVPVLDIGVGEADLWIEHVVISGSPITFLARRGGQASDTGHA